MGLWVLMPRVSGTATSCPLGTLLLHKGLVSCPGMSFPGAQQGKTCQQHCGRAVGGFGATRVGFGTIWEGFLPPVCGSGLLEGVTAELLCQAPSSWWIFPSSDLCSAAGTASSTSPMVLCEWCWDESLPVDLQW